MLRVCGLFLLPHLNITSSSASEKLGLTSRCLPWGLDSPSVSFHSPFLSFLSSLLVPELCSCSMLNEGTATLGCAVTNWHRGGRWWWGGDWLPCHLLQRHELISVPQSNHTCSTCNPDFGYFVHTCTRSTPPSQQILIHMPPCTSLLSPLVSMMCALEALANCQRVSAWILSEAKECRGIWQRDRAQANGRLVGPWEPWHTAYYRYTTSLAYYTWQQTVLFTELLS